MQTVNTSQKAQPRERGGHSIYYDDLRSRVIALLSTDLEPGSRIPSDRQLSQQLGISNVTLVRLMHDLQREGWVQRVPGKGTFTATKMPAPPAAPAPEFNVANDMADEVDWAPALPSVEMQVRAHTAILAPLGVRPEHARQVQNREPVTVSRIERTIQQTGGQTIVVNRQTTDDHEIETLIHQLRDSGVNSIVFVGSVSQEENELWLPPLQAWQEESTLPFVNVCIHESSYRPHYDTVSFNSGWGAYLIGKHLRELGHHSLLYVVPESVADSDFVQDRLAGLKRAMSSLTPKGQVDLMKVSLPADVNPITDLLDFPADGRDQWRACGEIAAEMLVDDERSAIVLANDKTAQYFIERSRELGRNLAGDVSVVGYDDRYNSSALGLTTVHPPIENMAEYAAQLALRRLQKPDFDGLLNLVLKPHLIVRSSTKHVFSI